MCLLIKVESPFSCSRGWDPEILLIASKSGLLGTFSSCSELSKKEKIVLSLVPPFGCFCSSLFWRLVPKNSTPPLPSSLVCYSRFFLIAFPFPYFGGKPYPFLIYPYKFTYCEDCLLFWFLGLSRFKVKSFIALPCETYPLSKLIP